MLPRKSPPPRSYPTGIVLCVMLCLVSSLKAQTVATPKVSFSCDFPGSDPAHYGFTVRSDGHASYISDGKLTKDSDADEPFTTDFSLSPSVTSHIFDLAQRAHYFEGGIASKKKNIASTGEKMLMYQDGQRNTVANYNYSIIPAVQELTTLFQSLSATLEFGRRLEYEYHYQKLALDEELKRMEDLSARGALAEVGVIAPILQRIVSDPSVINGVRACAQRVLDSAKPASK